jgi:hypothetical protein
VIFDWFFLEIKLLKLILIFFILSHLNDHVFAVESILFEAKNPKELIVFVHGTTGDPKGTWFNEKNNFFFPKGLFQDETIQRELGGVDVVSYGYVSSCVEFSKSVSANSSELFDFIRKKDVKKGYKRIVIIAHSLGGIITKRMVLSELSNSLINKIKVIVNLGVPHWGANKLYDFIRGSMSKVCVLNEHLKDLDGSDGSFLDDINSDWRSKIYSSSNPKRFLYVAGVELKDFAAVGGRVVPKYSATQFSTDAMVFRLDHAELAKPDSPHDSVYQWIKDLLIDKKMTADKMSASEERAIRNGYDDMSMILVSSKYKQLLDYQNKNKDLAALEILGSHFETSQISIEDRFKLFAAYYASKSDFFTSLKVIEGNSEEQSLKPIFEIIRKSVAKKNDESSGVATWWPFGKHAAQVKRVESNWAGRLKTSKSSVEEAFKASKDSKFSL